ncbi:multidrug ABC transporter ATP-binding protein [Bradyrhizobium sp. CCBAU 51745]|uniref:ribosome-associated ATPase/putative transporter RbbA n=1 Tax=Bradyrhizobium sp. CCBAU 51745 TaxID=1325099 RepID=UPI002305F342|nr:ribosome-associated ATPase/putative transporter RbbA [Bradyrhizobium sp. CCBAU 51745]MDA9444995.1 multidrug ABC transporter ATP-binding protein [Bradyrhizobium sp. CCBAU 51745]
MSPAEPFAVEVSEVAHRYGKVTALADIGLSVRAGNATALVGPDGVGKSTLLALIAGVRRLQAGSIRTLGGDIASHAHRDDIMARIAYMPQGLGRNLYPSLSVAENIDYFGRLFGQSGAERAARIKQLLRATGLAPFFDRPAGNLSGGMKQKLSLCCTLIHDPDLLILDEPTTGVDPLSRRQFWRLIDDIRAQRPQLTVLVSTAYMEEAERFDHVVAIDAGRVLARGAPAELLKQTGTQHFEQAYIALHGGSVAPEMVPIAPLPPSADGKPAIVAEGLTRRFGDFVAVDHVSFSIRRGEIFGFLGSNGCGKTTTMKMLTGLLDISEGRAELLGRPVEAGDLSTRLRVGYMSQGFSLYEELTVRENLALDARLYRIAEAEVKQVVDRALEHFGLVEAANSKPPSLPLGMRQRLQLAAACLHRPEVMILDEPTSGVDPAARDMFWRLLGELSRRDGVTIFVSTHFMNEAERCDRISLMHAGKVLAVGTPSELRLAKDTASLEDAFIAHLEEADPEGTVEEVPRAVWTNSAAARPLPTASLLASLRRMWAFSYREMRELLRDWVRLGFALLGPLLLLLTFGYGITFDVENLSFAVLDRDHSADSRQLVESFAASRYFRQMTPLRSETEVDRRLRAGDLRLVIDIPPGYGRDLVAGRQPEVGFFLDGATPFHAETTRNYVDGIVLSYVEDLARRTRGAVPDLVAASLEPRFRYNQDFRSVFALTPGLVMIFMVLFPSMLAALGVVRERELGSITNLYASPATVAEFLLGKQLPYILFSCASFVSLLVLASLAFGVIVKGSVAALALGGMLYVFASTAFGILVSVFVRSQVAAIIVTAIVSTVPAINFSGYLYPAAALQGSGRFIGMSFPSLWFQNISLGTITKARGFVELYPNHLILLAFGLAYLVAASLLLRKQDG